MNIRYNWAPDLSATGLSDNTAIGAEIHAHRVEQNARLRLPSLAISVVGHLFIAYLALHVTMSALKPPPEIHSISVTISQPQQLQPALPEPAIPQLEKPSQVVQDTPLPEISTPSLQIMAAPAEASQAPVTSAASAEKASAEPALSPPVFDAAYLNNPKPVYPNMSRRLREIGTVQLRVRVSTAGQPLEITLAKSSGYKRLDDAALETVRKYRFEPAKRGETAIEAWVVVPVEFSLNHL